MKIFDIVDGILSTLNVPFYAYMPEFAREPPPLFISYDVYDTPKNYGDGKEIVTRAYITFNVFGGSVSEIDRVYSELTALLRNNGFVRSGAKFNSENDFPKYTRIAVDYSYDLETE